MAIPKHMHLLFEQLMQAASEGTLALVESRDRHSGAVRYVLASVDKEGDEHLVFPFGHLSEAPFEDYVDPLDYARGRPMPIGRDAQVLEMDEKEKTNG